MATKQDLYSASDIQVLEGMEAVRKRPGMYIGGTDQRGVHQLIFEPVDNAIDEFMAGFCSRVDILVDREGIVTVTDDGRGIPVDKHKATGVSALETVMTTLHAGGKFGGKAYSVSAGLHGVGVSAVNALSEWLTVDVYRNQRHYHQKFAEGQDKKHGTRAWLQRRYRNVPKHTRPPLEAPLALLLSTQSHPDEEYAELSPERNIEIQRTRNIDLKNVARHEAGHHGLELSGEQGEEFNRPMDYLTITDEDPYYRKAALKHLGITEPEMIRMLESETAFRKKLNKMLKESNARLIAQGRPPIDNQAVIKKALAERRQALSRPVYPDIPERGLYTGYDTASRGKENNTGGIIERNPYPYESRAI